MSQLLERLNALRERMRLRFLKGMNWAAGSLLTAALLAHQAYPGVISDTIGKLPPLLGLPAIILFCGVVHYALSTNADKTS